MKMEVNLNIVNKLFGISKKIKDVKSPIGKVVNVHGNLIKIVSGNKLYLIAVNDSTVLKPGNLVNLLFSNRQVTTPQVSNQNEKFVEAKLLFEGEIENFENIGNTLKEANSSTQIKSDLAFLDELISNEKITTSLTLLKIDQIENLFGDLKELLSTDEIKNFKLENSEKFKKNLVEFLIRIRGNIPKWFSLPKDIRINILKLYTGLLDSQSDVQRTENARSKANNRTIFEKVEHEIQKKNSENLDEKTGTLEKTKIIENVKSENSLIKKYEINNYQKRSSLLKLKVYFKNLSEQTVKMPLRKFEIDSLTLEKTKNLNSDKLIMKFPRKIEWLRSTDFGDSKTMKKTLKQIMHEKEVRELVKVLKFSLLKSKDLQSDVIRIQNNTPKNNSSTKNVLINLPANYTTIIDVKSEKNFIRKTNPSYYSNHLKNSEPPNFLQDLNRNPIQSSTQTFTDNSNSLKEKIIFEEFFILKQENQLENLKTELLKYMNNQDTEKIVSLFKQTTMRTIKEIDRSQFPLKINIVSQILKSSLEELINRIMTKLDGNESTLKKLKNLLREFSDKISSSYVNEKKETFLDKVDERRMIYSKIFDSLNDVVGMRTIFLKFENMYSRIDFISKEIDPKIKKGFRLIFDLSLKNLGKVVINITINSSDVDMHLFVQKDAEKIFRENYKLFKEIFETEGHHLQSFFVMNIEDSKGLMNERHLLLTNMGGNYNWMA